MGFRSVIDLLQDGVDAVNAACANRPLSQLLENDLDLLNQVRAITLSQALFIRNAPCATAALAGQPVYFDAGNARYDQALADGTAKQNLVGFIQNKPSSTLADVQILGYGPLSLTNALNGAGLAAGRYYLSTTNAGVIVATPVSPTILACIADGLGNVVVLPQQPGLLSPLVSLSGTTVNADTQIYTKTSAQGLHGVLTFKNTGGSNGLTLTFSVTDAFGTSNAAITQALTAGQTHTLSLHSVLSGVLPPYTTLTVQIRSTTSGQHTTYSVRGSVIA